LPLKIQLKKTIKTNIIKTKKWNLHKLKHKKTSLACNILKIKKTQKTQKYKIRIEICQN